MQVRWFVMRADKCEQTAEDKLKGGHKVLCVFSYRRQSLFHYILPVLLGQMEPAAKIRLCQSQIGRAHV